MSAIFGLFDRNGLPVDATVISSMEQVFTKWPHDSRSGWCEGAVGLGHVSLWNTPESKNEVLPKVHGANGKRLVITADVRLDNRQELACKLQINDPPSSITDSDFILLAYRKWGENCPRELLGDFAFVIWDELEEKIFCARDHVGIRSFYYRLDEAGFSFASHVHGVAAAVKNSLSICKDAVYLYLKEGELYSSELTFYEGIKKLPPASTMTITEGSLDLRSYWRLEDVPPIEEDTIEAYTATLKQLLAKAVECRLRTDYSVASHLSGGLDSSAIAAMAAKILSQRGESLSTYNWCPAPCEGEKSADPEWALAAAMAKQAGIAHRSVELNSEKFLAILKDIDISTGDTSDLWYEFEVRKAVACEGQRTLLSGWGGDQLISNYGNYSLIDMFLHGHAWEVPGGIWNAVGGKKRKLRKLLGLVYRGIISPCLDHLRSRLKRPGSDHHQNFAAYTYEDVAREIEAISPIPWNRAVLSVRDDQLTQYKCGHLQNRLDSWAAAAYSTGIDYRFPLLDKRIIEYAVSLPPQCYWHNGQIRFLFREAIAGIVPPAISSSPIITEGRRVQKLLDIEMGAIKPWFQQQSSSGLVGEGHSSYIDFAALAGDMQMAVTLDSSQQDMISHRFDCMIKAIFLSGLESHFQQRL